MRMACRVLVLIVLTVLASAPVMADKTKSTTESATPTPAPAPTPTQSPAERIADRAIRLLVAWKHVNARTVLEQHHDQFGDSQPFTAANGLLSAEEDQIEEAMALLGEAEQAAPGDPAAAFYRGELLYWQRDYDGAATVWQAAHDRARARVENEPADPRATYYLGASLVRLQQYEDAREVLGKALELGFDTAMVRYQIGLSYAYQKSWQEAIDTLGMVIEADGGFAHAYYFRARAWQGLKKTDEMMLDLDRFLNLAPNAREAAIARSLLAAGAG